MKKICQIALLTALSVTGCYAQTAHEQNAKKATELLRYTTLTVQEISAHLGFDTATYFVRLFRKHEGVTPLQYRESQT